MIELTAQGNERVALNPANVWHIRRAGDQTAIYSTAGSVLFVMDSYDDVLSACRNAVERM